MGSLFRVEIGFTLLHQFDYLSCFLTMATPVLLSLPSPVWATIAKLLPLAKVNFLPVINGNLPYRP